MSEEYPEVTNEAYARWLRAQKPPDWFWAMSLLEQEQLACLGEEYVGICIDAGVEAGTKPESEAEQVQRLVREALQKPQDGPQAPAQDITSMGGVTRRQQRRERQQQEAKDEGRSFLGRQADEVASDA